MKDKYISKKLELTMAGADGIMFRSHSFCGDANDGVSISYECHQTCAPTHGWSPGGVLRRKDIKKLIKFLNKAIELPERKINRRSNGN